MKILFGVFLFLGLGCSSKLSNFSIDKNAKSLTDNFFAGISKHDAANALKQLLESNSNINLKDSATLHLTSRFSFINETSGSFTGYRLLKQRTLEDDIAIYSYLVKYEKKFFRFVFMYYNNGSSVKLYKFLYDEDIDVELEASLKLYVN